jgi:hypothetical protein
MTMIFVVRFSSKEKGTRAGVPFSLLANNMRFFNEYRKIFKKREEYIAVLFAPLLKLCENHESFRSHDLTFLYLLPTSFNVKRHRVLLLYKTTYKHKSIDSLSQWIHFLCRSLVKIVVQRLAMSSLNIVDSLWAVLMGFSLI